MSRDSEGLAFIYARQGTTEFVNQQLLDYLGRPLKELQTWAFNDTMHAEELNRVTREWRANIAAGHSYAMEHRVRRADGMYRWAQVSVVPRHDASERLLDWCGVVFDVDDAKRFDSVAAPDNGTQQHFIDSLPGLVYTMTPACEIELVNRQVREYFGRSFGGVRNWDRIECVHPADIARLRESLCRTVEFGARPELAHRLRRADGTYRWFKPRAYPKRDAHGRIVRWYVALVDVHEPGAGAKNNGARVHFSRTGFIGRAVSTADRVFAFGNVTDEHLAQLHSLFHPAPCVKQSLNLNDVVLGVCDALEKELRKERVTLHLDLQSHLPRTPADRVQMQRLTANLVGNAMEAMAGLCTPRRELSIRTRAQGGEVIVQVEDSGVGLTDAEIVYEPFYTTKQNRMGIGLSICRSIADTHGGRLWAVPKTGAGTTFHFAMPIWAPSAKGLVTELGGFP
jgi:PAS domain S-box-containing protein